MQSCHIHISSSIFALVLCHLCVAVFPPDFTHRLNPLDQLVIFCCWLCVSVCFVSNSNAAVTSHCHLSSEPGTLMSVCFWAQSDRVGQFGVGKVLALGMLTFNYRWSWHSMFPLLLFLQVLHSSHVLLCTLGIFLWCSIPSSFPDWTFICPWNFADCTFFCANVKLWG